MIYASGHPLLAMPCTRAADEGSFTQTAGTPVKPCLLPIAHLKLPACECARVTIGMYSRGTVCVSRQADVWAVTLSCARSREALIHCDMQAGASYREADESMRARSKRSQQHLTHLQQGQEVDFGEAFLRALHEEGFTDAQLRNDLRILKPALPMRGQVSSALIGLILMCADVIVLMMTYQGLP